MDRSIRFWGAIIGCLVMMAACGDQGKPPEPPKVVTQKIVVPANQPAAGGPAPAPSPAAPPAAPAAAPSAPAVASPPAPGAAPATQVAGAPSAPAAVPPAAPVATPTTQAAAPATPVVKTAEPAAVPPPLPPASGPAAAASAATPVVTPAPAGLQQGVATAPAAPQAGTTAALPAVEVDKGAAGGAVMVAYSAEGRVDPFAPLFHAQAPAIDQTTTDASASARKKRIAHTPLERMDISQFKLVAIVQAASGNRALVEDASGKGYVLTKGTYIGVNAGIVIDIQRDKVIVEEESEDLYGRVSIQEKELKLQKPLGDM